MAALPGSLLWWTRPDRNTSVCLVAESGNRTSAQLNKQQAAACSKNTATSATSVRRRRHVPSLLYCGPLRDLRIPRSASPTFTFDDSLSPPLVRNCAQRLDKAASDWPSSRQLCTTRCVSLQTRLSRALKWASRQQAGWVGQGNLHRVAARFVPDPASSHRYSCSKVPPCTESSHLPPIPSQTLTHTHTHHTHILCPSAFLSSSFS